jgi:hypothetical protein
MDSDLCVVCKGDYSCGEGMNHMCADCYWEDDYEQKKARRNDPVLRFHRLCSLAITMGMDTTQAVAFALKEMGLTAPPTSSSAIITYTVPDKTTD